PMVLLVGHVERRDVGRLALQEQNYARLLSDITKLVIEVIDPDQASEAIARSFHTAESGTPGPVAVVLPEDIFDQQTEAPLDQPRQRYVPAAREEDIDRLAAMLAAAERPLILVGGALLADAVHDEGVLEDLARLAAEWVLPVSPTHRRPQLFDSDNPNYGGYVGIRVPRPQIEAMKRADLMVALGERLTDTVSQSYTFPSAPQPQLPLVHVWPDANEVGRVWRPDLGIPASPADVLRALLRRAVPQDAEKRRGWVESLNEIHRGLLAKSWESAPDGLNFADVVCEIDKHLAPDAIVSSDAGNFSSYIHRYIGFHKGQAMLSSVVGAMGSGMPMAVAAALRRPGTQTVAFLGDGGALMTGNELATALQYGVNPIMIIADNSMYGTIGMHSYMRYPERPFMGGTRLTNPDFAAWGRSFGAEAITIRDESEVESGIAKAFAIKDRPVVVHCLVSALQMSAWLRYEESDVLP
ncbi:MAG TPA: thiamine pyrophosphate-dependent enzyme, partial [Dehalococcoidia bacterium]|nr:thiamine pyrophosphate-dependent enzyme [Dehalococcoidia bacterium]